MRLTTLLAAAVSAAATVGCGGGNTAGPTADRCSQPPVIAAGLRVADFRERIARQTAVAPADSLLEVTLRFAGSVTAADRAGVEAASGDVTYVFAAQPSLAARFRARDLAVYVAAAPTDRLVDASLGLRTCASD